MSKEAELLALRKQLLVTRVAVQRLRIARELHTLREYARWPRLAASFLASTQARSLLATLLMMMARRTRLARVARIAAVVVVLAQIARTILRTTPRSQVADESRAEP